MLRREEVIRVFLFLVLLTTILATTDLLAEEADIHAANQLELFYDSNLDESVVDDRLDIDLTYGRFSAGLVFLSHSPSDHRLLDPNDFGARVEGIRKRWVMANADPFTVRLGDSYVNFGNGLVLRVFEDQSVDFDNVLDGVYVTADRSGFVVEGIAGTNSLGPERTIVKGVGGRYESDSGWLIGLSGAIIDSVDGTSPTPGRDEIAGVQASAYLPGGIDVAAEHAIRRYKPETEGSRSPADGHATYLEANASFGPFTIFLEGKELLRFDHAYTTPPPVARQHTSTLLNRGSHIPNIRLDDERGYQAELMWTLTDDVYLTGNYSESEAQHDELPAWEAYGQVEADLLGGHWVVTAAETEEKIREGEGRTFVERISYGADYVRQLGESNSIELFYETQGVQLQELATADYRFPVTYRDHLAAVTFSMSPRNTWSATLEWSDSPTEVKESWVWIEWGIRLGTLGQLTLAGGSLRGGQVCSGGVCKLVDPFEGGRIELLTNF